MQKIPWKEKISYGFGATGLDLSYGLFYSYLSIYLTNVLGIKSAFLLILAPLARLWDGINDPMMGAIVDRTNTKFGKRRPWILIGAAANAVVLSLLFNASRFATGATALYVYVAVFYVLWGMTNTLADIPYWSMVPSFTSDEKERNLISTIARTFSGLGQGIIALFTPIALKKLSADGNPTAQGFSTVSVVSAVCLVLFALVSVSFTKERRIVKPEESFSFKKAVKNITGNDQLLIFMLFAMISNAGFYMISGVSSYYFTVVRGDIALQSTFNLFNTVGSVLAILVVPVFSKFMSNRGIYIFCLSAALAGYCGMAVCGLALNTGVVAIGVFYFLASIGTGSMFVNQTIMLSDIVDYGEFTTGRRNEALTFSMKGFLQKMAYTFQSIIMYATFITTGYDDFTATAAASASAAAQRGISLLMFAVPPVMMLISLCIFIKKYKIHGALKAEIIEAINAKYADDTPVG